jgi:hypothetical protein
VNASATLFLQHSNSFTAAVTETPTSIRFMPRRSKVATLQTDATSTPSFTPVLANGNIQRFRSTYAGGQPTPTIVNHATATLSLGDEMTIILEKTGANQIGSTTWGTQYKTSDGSTGMTNWFAAGTVQSGYSVAMTFTWNGTVWSCFNIIGGTFMPVF